MSNIFIKTYHAVKDLFSLPIKMINKNKKQKLIDEKMQESFRRKERIREEKGEMPSLLN